MKFWQEANKDKTETRFVFQNAPSKNDGEPSNPNSVSEEKDREAAVADTSSALTELRSKIDAEKGIENIPFDEKLEILVRIARNDFKSDQTGDSRGWMESARDAALSAIKSVSSSAAESAENKLALSDEAYIVDLLKDESVLIRFITEYQEDALNLFTDKTGENTFQANFFGNEGLKNRANFMDLLSTEPEHKFLEIGGTHFVRSPQGYVSFHPAVGQRAQIQSQTVFSVSSSLDNYPEAADSLANIKDTNPLFANIEGGTKVARLEANRKLNFQTAETWKRLSEKLSSKFRSNPVVPLLEKEIPERFRLFLNANFYVVNLSKPGENFQIPGHEKIKPLKSTDDPQEFRTRIKEAMTSTKSYIETAVKKYAEQIGKEENGDKKKIMIEEIGRMKQKAPEFFREITTFIEEEKKNDNLALDANGSRITEELKGNSKIPNFEIDSRKLLAEFDKKFYEMVANKELNEEALLDETGLFLSKMLGLNPNKDELDNHPRIKNLILGRINIMVKSYGLSNIEKSAKTMQEEHELDRVVSDERVQKIIAELGIDPNKSPLDIADLEAISKKLGAKYQEVKDSKDIPPQAINYYRESADFFSDRVKRFKKAKQEEEKSQKEAQYVEEKIAGVTQKIKKSLTPGTKEYKNFRKSVDTTADYIREYRAKNNGKSPDFSREDFQNVREQFEFGESEETVRDSLRDLNQKESEKTITSTPIVSLENLPKGATNGKTLENGNLAFNVGETELEVNIATNMMFPRGTKGPQKDWLSFEAKSENTASVQLASAMMGASVEDGQEGTGLMVRALGKDKFQKLINNLSYPRMGRVLQRNEVEGLQAVKNKFGGIKVIFEKLNLLRPDGQAAPEKAGQKSQEFFDILTSAAVGNFKKLEAPSEVQA